MREAFDPRRHKWADYWFMNLVSVRDDVAPRTSCSPDEIPLVVELRRELRQRAEFEARLVRENDALINRLDAAYEAAGLSQFSSKPLEAHVAEMKAELALASEWRATIPKCSWHGCTKIGVKWISRTVLNCDAHGSAYLQDAPWAELARSQGL